MTKTSIVQITAIESVKINSWPNGTEPSASARIAAPNARPPPRMRQSIGRRSLVSARISSTPSHRYGRNDQSEQKDRLAIEDARQPAGSSGHRQDAGRQRQAADHLHHAELGAHLLVRPGIAGDVAASDDLGRHGVGDHVLHDGADDDQHRAEKVEMVGAGEGYPSAGGAREREHSACRQGRADEDIGPALRAEDGHAVDQLAEHHLDGPGQGQPDADPGELGRVQGQLLLDPHVAADVDDAQRAIGEIDHHQRQIGEAEALDRSQQGGQPGRACGRRPRCCR